ncbi:SDR family NAD(P)-dependent oxidoreductase [Streptomyces milbemycinicus]|uniref:SDR family NAD(P)-dependent oxidoreductase n=1 Tax=Streptomyces milbemycinicus TaxID=476552 RepID=UPI003410E90D
MSHRVSSATELYELVRRGQIDKVEALRLAREMKRAKTAEPAGVDQDAVRDRVCDVLADKVRQLLKVSADDLDVDVELSEYGLDSVVISHLVSMVNDALGLALKPTALFEHPNLRALATHIVDEHGAGLADRLGLRPRREPPAPKSTAPERIRKRTAPKPVTGARFQPTPIERPRTGEPIAIIGMSGRFPQADDVEAFWRNLFEGRDCISEVPADRWDWRECYGDPFDEAGRTTVKWGGFMDGVADFDPEFFGIAPKEARLMDPQQRLLMLHVWKALEDAGYAADSLAGSDLGIIVGTATTGYHRLIDAHAGGADGVAATATVPSIGPNRMSFFLDAHGPSEPVETACSSSLVALHRAVAALDRDECSVAVAGGVNTVLVPDGHISFGRAGMLSEDGRSKTFSDRADGYTRGEGVGMLVLKRLVAAERDGDHIHGLIRATAVNHGGRANSLTAPNPKAQAAVIRDAYRRAGVDPRTIGYIEAHGTGTKLGDPVEINGVKEAFRDLYADFGAEVTGAHCGIGSVKTNIGHLELSAGVAGVIKVLLQMRHRTLVESLHCDTVNPYIELEGSPFFLVRERQPWAAQVDADGVELPRRAGVSSFGFGGANAHVVLEEYVPPAEVRAERAPVAVVLSANEPETLVARARQLLAWIDERGLGDEDMASLAYTLQVGRVAMPERLAFVAETMADVRAGLRAYLADDRPNDLHRGRAQSDAMWRALVGDEDIADAMDSWVAKGKLASLLGLWAAGFDFDWRRLYGSTPPCRMRLPTYPFNLRRFWIADRDDPTRAASGPEPRHRRVLDGSEYYLRDHCLRGVPTLPAVAYLELVRQALAGSGTGVRIHDVRWLRPIEVTGPRHVEVRLDPADEAGRRAFEVHVDGDAAVFAQGTGEVDAASARTGETVVVDRLRDGCAHSLDAAEFYRRYGRIGMDYGPALRTVRSLHYDVGIAVARLSLPPEAESPLVLNPSLLDGALQAVLGVWLGENDGTAGRLALPFAVREVQVHAATPADGWVVIRGTADDRGGEVRRLDVDICDTDGRVCVRLLGFSTRTLPPAEPAADLPWRDHGVYLLTGGTGELTAALAEDIARKVDAPTLILSGAGPAGAAYDDLAAALCGSGAVAVYRELDVTDRAAVTEALRDITAEHRALHGIVHIGRDGDALRTLDEASAALPLECFVALHPADAPESARTCLMTQVWDAEPVRPAPQWPAERARVVLLGGSPEDQAEFRRRCPDTTVLDAEDPAAGLPAGAEHVVVLAPAATRTAFRLIKAVLAGGADAREIGWTVLTKQARLLPGDIRVDPDCAGVHGLFGSLAKEYPHWRVRVVDVPAGAPVPWDDVLALPPEPTGALLAHRNGEWYRQRLLELAEPVPAEAVHAGLQPDDVVVAIGGSGGIGTVWTEHMMRRHKARVVWIGRRPLDADIEARRRRFAAHGPMPDYIQADATDPAALRRARDEIVRRHGPVRGVLHSAIVLGDQSLARMDEARFDATYAAKADVAVNIADAFAGEPLDFVVFFSSLQSFLASPGQANYAAGCTFADAFAEHLGTRHTCPVKVVNWGYWGGVGVVADDTHRERMARAGVDSIEPAEGMATYDTLMGSRHPRLALVKLTNTQAVDGLRGDDAIEQLDTRSPALITLLREGRPDRTEEVARLREKTDGHDAALDAALVKISWAVLRSLGLFDSGRAGTAAEWRARGGIADSYDRWLQHTLNVLTDTGHLRQDRDGRYRAAGDPTVDTDGAWAAWERERDRWLAEESTRAQVTLVDTTLRALGDILTGRRPATDVLFPASSVELVEGVYKANPVADYFNDVLAETLVDYVRRRITDNPRVKLRVLEIGAGTGGTSETVFRHLRPWRDHIETYCCTDISKAFLLHARREFGETAPYLDTRLFDVEEPLAGQPIPAGGFDVAIATNVLHATRNIRTTLHNTKAALRANGILLLNELSGGSLFSHLTFGLLDGWWRYDDPAPRVPGTPTLTPATWRRLLAEAGFRGAFLAADGAEDLGQQVVVAESDGAVRRPRPQAPAQRPADYAAQRQSRVDRGERHGRTLVVEGTARLSTGELVAELHRAWATTRSHVVVAEQAPGAEPAGSGPASAAVADRVVELLAGVLEVDPAQLEPDVPLRRYGFDSIFMVQFLSSVKKHIDDTMSLDVIAECQTLRDIIDRVGASAAAATEPATTEDLPELVRMNRGGVGRPVFWIHHGNGGVESYAPLAERCGRPFYGIRPKGWMGSGEILSGQVPMADHYASVIRAVQPEGPYDIGGFSMGGLLAYEVVRRLQMLGAEVNTLVMLDTLDAASTNRVNAIMQGGRSEPDVIAKVCAFRAVNLVLGNNSLDANNGTTPILHRDEVDPSLPYPEFLDSLLKAALAAGITKTETQLRTQTTRLARYLEVLHTGHHVVDPLPRRDAVRCYYVRNRSGRFFGDFEDYMVLFANPDLPGLDGTEYWREWEEQIDDFFVTEVDTTSHTDVMTAPQSLDKVLRLCDALYAAEPAHGENRNGKEA